MRPWVLVAGPHTSGAPTEAARASNRLALNRAAVEVHRRGYLPVVGVNAVMPVLDAAGAPPDDERMLAICLELADRCDAVLRIGGPSAGADAEVERVRARGGRVYRDVRELPFLAP